MSTDQLSCLPLEIKTTILSYLPVPQIVQFRRVSSHFRSVIDDPQNNGPIVKRTEISSRLRVHGHVDRLTDYNVPFFEHVGRFIAHRFDTRWPINGYLPFDFDRLAQHWLHHNPTVHGAQQLESPADTLPEVTRRVCLGICRPPQRHDYWEEWAQETRMQYLPSNNVSPHISNHSVSSYMDLRSALKNHLTPSVPPIPHEAIPHFSLSEHENNLIGAVFGLPHGLEFHGPWRETFLVYCIRHQWAYRMMRWMHILGGHLGPRARAQRMMSRLSGYQRAALLEDLYVY